jgi:hypothetical protein
MQARSYALNALPGQRNLQPLHVAASRGRCHRGNDLRLTAKLAVERSKLRPPGLSVGFAYAADA